MLLRRLTLSAHNPRPISPFVWVSEISASRAAPSPPCSRPSVSLGPRPTTRKLRSTLACHAYHRRRQGRALPSAREGVQSVAALFGCSLAVCRAESSTKVLIPARSLRPPASLLQPRPSSTSFASTLVSSSMRTCVVLFEYTALQATKLDDRLRGADADLLRCLLCLDVAPSL